MKKLLMPILVLIVAISLAACGAAPVTLVDVTSDTGISLKIPSDLILQADKSYLNTKTGDSVVLAVADVAGSPLSGYTQDQLLATYQSKYPDAAIKSFENGKQINGKESLVADVSFSNDKGTPVNLTLVIVTDGTKNYVVNFGYANDSSDSTIVKNLQTCIDSITIK